MLFLNNFFKKTEYESQISILKTSLQELSTQYELKLKEFEKMLKGSSETIKNLQAAIKESHKKYHPYNYLYQNSLKVRKMSLKTKK